MPDDALAGQPATEKALRKNYMARQPARGASSRLRRDVGRL